MKLLLVGLVGILLTSSSFATRLEISTESGFYKVWIRETIEPNQKSELYDLYEGLNSQEISAPTSTGLISRKVLKNSVQNYKFACVLLDHFKTNKTKELICDMDVARFTNDNYEAYYYELPKKEIDILFHGENAKEMTTRMGLSDNGININIDEKLKITGDDFTLNIAISE
jgi:hypothetical protein